MQVKKKLLDIVREKIKVKVTPKPKGFGE